MKIFQDITGAIKDIKKVGFNDAMRGLFIYSTVPCWLKYHLICKRTGHDFGNLSNECWTCWRLED